MYEDVKNYVSKSLAVESQCGREPLLITHIARCEKRTDEVRERVQSLFTKFSSILMPAVPQPTATSKEQINMSVPPAVEYLQRLESSLEGICEMLEEFSKRGEA